MDESEKSSSATYFEWLSIIKTSVLKKIPLNYSNEMQWLFLVAFFLNDFVDIQFSLGVLNLFTHFLSLSIH